MYKEYVIGRSTIEESVREKAAEMSRHNPDKHYEVVRGQSWITPDGRIAYVWLLVERRYMESM